jgi:hypothetical protein
MKFINRIFSILIVMLMLLSTGTAFAATESYEAGYDAGFDYGYDKSGSKIFATTAYSKFKDTIEHRKIKRDIDDYIEREFRQGFIKGFSDSYEYEDNEDNDNEEQKVEYAATLGKLLGENYGARDFQDGKKSDWKKSLPSKSVIESMFNLSIQSSDYRSNFVSDLNKAFEEGYIEAYDRAKYEPTKVTLEQGVKDGEDIGMVVGAAYGAKDFYAGRDSDFKRDMPSKNEITEQFSLNNDNLDYEGGFISGFISAYEESYNQAYREANTDVGLKKAISETIPISGGTLVTDDKRFAVEIPSGTFYHDVNLSIVTSFDVDKTNYNNLIKASDSYAVEFSNSSGNIDESNTIKLSFEYYGDKFKGGIYRKDGSNWFYIPTDIEDGKLSAKINPKMLNSQSTTFSVFVNDNTVALRDIRGHWANDEIDAFVRRGVINGYSDMTFKPDNNITRAEFLTLLSGVFKWNIYTHPGSTTVFKDADTFGYYSDVINYATSNNYISGYTDGTFKPENLISYAEVEIIMNRVLYYQGFRWVNIANSMLYEKKARSNSFYNINNKITRAEMVYMLYNTTE